MSDIHYLILRYERGREEHFGITPGSVRPQDKWIKFTFHDKSPGWATTEDLQWFKESITDPFTKVARHAWPDSNVP